MEQEVGGSSPPNCTNKIKYLYAYRKRRRSQFRRQGNARGNDNVKVVRALKRPPARTGGPSSFFLRGVVGRGFSPAGPSVPGDLLIDVRVDFTFDVAIPVGTNRHAAPGKVSHTSF